MQNIQLPSFDLIGLRLPFKTTNKNGQSGFDCGKLWQKFEEEKIASKINGKSGDEVYAVYFDYDGDENSPFSYFIGCKVDETSEIPAGLDKLEIPAQEYLMSTAKGKMPDCISNEWKQIWVSELNRAFTFDFEIYDHRSVDWENAEVDVYISTK